SRTLPDKRLLECRVKFEFVARPPRAIVTSQVARVSAEFELAYKLKESVTPTPAQLTAFSRVNAVYNAWPYWREFLQSAVHRMDLPGITLPLAHVQSIIEWADSGSIHSPKRT